MMNEKDEHQILLPESEKRRKSGNVSDQIKKSLKNVKNILIPDDTLSSTIETKRTELQLEFNQELNLADLEIITLVDSDEEKMPKSPAVEWNMTSGMRRDLIPYFDFMPDEVILKIFGWLPEIDMGRFALSNKRLFSYLEDESIWKPKALNWKNLRVSRGKNEPNLKQYYVQKFQDNTRMQIELEKSKKEREIRERRERNTTTLINIMNATFFNYRIFDIPICLCIVLWTIFMMLRSDEIILWNYHLVTTPIYAACTYVALASFVVFPLAEYANTWGISFPTSGNLLWLVASEVRLFGLLIVGLPWMVFLSFFMVYAYAWESMGEMTPSYAFIPLGVLTVPMCCVCSFACLSDLKRCNEDCAIGTAGIAVFFYFAWLVSFIAIKSDQFVWFMWVDAFVPFWLIFGVVICFYVGGWIAIICGPANNNWKTYGLFSMFFLPSLIGVLSWFVLLSINLDAEEKDLPLWPWTLVGIPIVVAELSATAGLWMLMVVING